MSRYAILLLAFILLTASSITIIQPVKASVESVGTSCSIFVDDIVEPQPIIVTVQIYPAPPSGEIFNDLIVTIVSPLQGTVGNYPWGTGPWSKRLSSGTNGKATVTFDIHTFGGYWNVELYFGGQYFANNTIYYQPIQSQRGFFISSAQTPSPSPSPTPSPTISPSPSPTASSSPSPSPTPLSNQEPSLTIAVTAVVIAVIMVGVGLLVYFKKRKR